MVGKSRTRIPDISVYIPVLKGIPMTQGGGGLDESALAAALRMLIDATDQVTEAVSVTGRRNAEIVLLVDALVDRVMGVAQAGWLADLNINYRAGYSELGRKRLAWAIGMENGINENDDGTQVCEDES